MFEHCLYFNTTSLARHLEREWSHAFKVFQLTPSQAFMLRVILERKHITGSALALEMNISKATCSRTVEGLIKHGYVMKGEPNKDARSYDLLPTQKARQIHAELNLASGNVTTKIKVIIGEGKFNTTVQNLKEIGSEIE